MDYKHILSQSDSDIKQVLVHGTIGRDVSGIEIANELRFLIEFEEVEEIDIRINSNGGSMVEGFGIISAMEHAKAKGIRINTINDGLAASMGGLIFVMGDHRRMMDFAFLMLHNPNFGSAKIKDEEKEIISKFRDSAIKIIMNSSGLSKKRVGTMLDNETWLTAEGAIDENLSDAVISTKHKKKKVRALNLIESGASALDVLNMYNGNITQIKMKKVFNLLNLNEDAKEESVVEAIKSIENEVNVLESEKATLETDLETVKNEKTTLETEVLELKTKLGEAGKTAVESLVNKAIEDKKIKKEAKESFVTMGLENMENLKTVLDNIEVPKFNLLNQIQNGVILPADNEKTFRELEKEDPKKLAKILNETPDLYFSMYKEEYGIEHPNKQ